MSCDHKHWWVGSLTHLNGSGILTNPNSFELYMMRSSANRDKCVAIIDDANSVSATKSLPYDIQTASQQRSPYHMTFKQRLGNEVPTI